MLMLYHIYLSFRLNFSMNVDMLLFFVFVGNCLTGSLLFVLAKDKQSEESKSQSHMIL